METALNNKIMETKINNKIILTALIFLILGAIAGTYIERQKFPTTSELINETYQACLGPYACKSINVDNQKGIAHFNCGKVNNVDFACLFYESEVYFIKPNHTGAQMIFNTTQALKTDKDYTFIEPNKRTPLELIE